MTARRWWPLPLLLAVVVDTGLWLHARYSPAGVVNRAVVRTLRSGACERSVLMRQAGLDHLLIEDTWVRGGQAVSVPATVDFNPGGDLTPQSRTLVQEGLEVDVAALTPAVASGATGRMGLVALYRQQQHRGAVWIQSPCAPFANPLRSGLQPLGMWRRGGQALQVFRGHVHSLAGSPGLFPRARVWVAIRSDHRVRFEWLQRRRTQMGNPPLRTIAERFTYPTHHLDRTFAARSAADRARFYRSDYVSVLADLHSLEAFAGVAHGAGTAGHAAHHGGGPCGGANARGTAATGLAGTQGGCAAGTGRSGAASGGGTGSRRSSARNAGQRS